MGYIQEQQDEFHARMEGRFGQRDDGQPVDVSLPDDNQVQPPQGYEEQPAPQQ